MAGRVSQLDQAAAITRVVQISAQAPAFREHVGKITASAAFKGSRRSQDFLTHIVEQALTGHFDALKERALGVELFGRSPSYDTGEDAIVRVTASDVRRRLQQYYGQNPSEWRIELPAGSYIPEFHKSETGVETRAEDSFPSSAGFGRRRSKLWYSLAGISVLGLLAAALWMGGRPYGVSAVQTPPWSAMLQNNRPIRILLCDPDISTLQQLLDFNISLPDYANKEFIPKSLANLPRTREYSSFLRGVNVAAVDTGLALAVSELAVQNQRHVRTQTARSIQISDLKTEDNLILMGSPRSNPWFRFFEKPLHFRFEFDNATKQEVIVNSNVRAGEQDRYVPTARGWGTGLAYGTVAFVKNPHETSHVMLLAGTNAEATEAAGKLATNVTLLAQTLRDHGLDQAGAPSFQILLKVGTMAGSPGAFEVVACHRLNDK